MKINSFRKNQRGSALLEALVAMLVFSIGIVGLLGLQAASIKNSIDAKYRSEASYMADQIIAQMWIDRVNMDSYVYNETGAACGSTNSGSLGNANVTSWLAQLAGSLPGTASATAQIQISTPFASTRQVKVTVCWKVPQETSTHNFATTAHINQ
jgi:type IV pilus assembly protein PilV